MIEFRASTREDMNWFFSKLSYTPSISFKGISAIKDGKIGAMVGFDHWTPNSVYVHVVATNPKCLAPIFVEVLRYVSQHGRRLLYGVSPSDNVRSLRLQKRLGFQERFRMKDGWMDGVDLVVNEFVIHERHTRSS